MRYFVASQHIGIRDRIDQLIEEGHEVVNWSYSFHSHIHGWEQKQVDFQTSSIHDPEYCKAWVHEHKDRWKGCDEWIAYYPPVWGLLMSYSGMPGTIYAPVRLGLDTGGRLQKYIKPIQDFIDAGIIRLEADSRFDQACMEWHLKRPCMYRKPVCKYFKAIPEPDKPWTIDSRCKLPDMKNAMPMTSKEPESWHTCGFIHVPYQASCVSAHERLSAGYKYLVPSARLLRKIWEKGFSSTEVHYGADGFSWRDNMDKMDWYSGDWPTIRTWDSFNELGALCQQEQASAT